MPPVSKKSVPPARSGAETKQAGLRSRNLFDPLAAKPFKLSRSKIEMFLECPRCFYLDRRLGVGRPDGPSFTLNIAVDGLLKKEFDVHRKAGEPHPLMRRYGLDLVPFDHPDLQTWRENFKGVQFLHPATNFLVTGAVDDVWVSAKGMLHVVDYKATSSAKEVSLEDAWKGGYKRQMEIYQWLLRKNGFTVADTGYFVYVNATQDREAFDGKLECSVTLLPYTGDDKWVEGAIKRAHACLCAENPPTSGEGCEWCAYRLASRNVELIIKN